VHILNPRNPRPTQRPLAYIFWGVSREQESPRSQELKNTTQIVHKYFKKSLSIYFLPKNRQKIQYVSPLDFFVLSRFGAFLSEGISKTPHETFYKNSASILFSQKNDKSTMLFFLGFVLSRFWAFFGQGSSMTPIKNKNRTTN
jgi:hypothetical protein